MLNWHELVRRRLSGLALDAADKDEVHAELAAHLEESYESLRTKGLTDCAARQQALAQVSDWKSLQREVYFAKKGAYLMQKRLQQLWIPGFLTLALSTVFLTVLQKLGFQPRVVSWSGPGTILLFVPWLALLPVLGAAGAYLSCRAGGSRPTALLASIFPVLAFASAFLLMFPIGFVIERIIGKPVDFGIVAAALLRDGFGWILVPGAALLVGGLLVQFLFGRPSWPQQPAIGGKQSHA